jgi:UDP-N-acetylglucosamine 2-epimerase
MKRIDLIAGARPNFMKIAPIIDALKAAQTRGGSLRFRLIHTGQHYDRAMSGASSRSWASRIRTSILKSARAPRLNRPPPSWWRMKRRC